MSYYSSKDCHKGLKLCFEYKGIRYYGAGWKDEKNEIMEAGFEGALLIDLDDNVKKTLEFRGLKAHALRKLSHYHDPACIKIFWPDYGAPALGQHFFERLLACIKEEGRDVVVFCYGGHGRTGTCLSILAALLGLTDDPVKMVREKVCEECVESETQFKYITKITGCKTSHHGKPIKYSSYSGTGMWDYTTGTLAVSNDTKKNDPVLPLNAVDKKSNILTDEDFMQYEVDWYNNTKSEVKKIGNKIAVCGYDGDVIKHKGEYHWKDHKGSVLFPLNAAEVKALKEMGHIKD